MKPCYTLIIVDIVDIMCVIISRERDMRGMSVHHLLQCIELNISIYLLSYDYRGAVRTGAMGALAPIEIGQWVPGTRPENNF